MSIKEKADYRFKKFIRFLKERKLYGVFKKDVDDVSTKQDKIILFTPSYNWMTNIIERNLMIYKIFHDYEFCNKDIYEMYEFMMTGDKYKEYRKYKNAIKEWRRVVTSENL